MKVALVVCILAATALAAPRYKRGTRMSPTLAAEVKAAEDAWTAAESETDPARQPAQWERAAAAFAQVDSASVDAQAKRDAARAAVLAWKNALDTEPQLSTKKPDPSAREPRPRPLPAREQSLVAALARYASYADAADPDLPGVLFLQANTYRRFDQLDLALPIFLSVIERFPRADVAEYSANLALDSYNRLGRYDDMIALGERLGKNASFLDGRDDLAATLRQIHRAALRMHAEALEKVARESRELEAYHAAGQAYLDIYNAAPEAPGNDEILYNAGVEFQEARSVSAAIQAFSLLERSYRNTKLAARATVRLGHIYGDIAMYDKAAEKLEDYAKRYAGEKDAFDALSDAVFYRNAIGDKAKAMEDTQYFIKTYGARKPADAAAAMFSLTALYESDPDLLLKHLRLYVRTFGSKGGAEPLAIAHAKIGLALWSKACPHALLDGLCVTRKRVARTCGSRSASVLVVTPRRETVSREAIAELTQALTLARSSDEPTARYYVGQIKLALADVELEKYLAIAFPKDLTFPPKDRAVTQANQKRFNEWIQTKQRAAAGSSGQYEAVFAIKDPASSITAAARIGIITQAFALEMVTADVPRQLRSGPLAAEGKQAYCDAMATAAEPLEDRAVSAFGVCLMKAQELGWYADSALFCERTLAELKPDEYPPARELRVPAEATAPVIASEPALR